MDYLVLSRILGIDYGERRIGLALSDPLKIIAKPLKIIDRKITTDYISEIFKIIDKYAVSKIVVGLPITMGGKHSNQTKVVIAFIDELFSIRNMQIIRIDERLSSIAAERSLKSQGVKISYAKNRIDETAAAIILQEYLDSQN